MPWTVDPTLVLGADGFLGRHFCRYFRERGWPIVAAGRMAGDLDDWATAERVFRSAPPVGRILHLVTRQRTGPVQYDMQGSLLAVNARIHLNILEAWRRFQPQARLLSLGSSCVYPEIDQPIPESAFQSGPLHPSVRGYGLAKQMLAVGCETYAAEFGLTYLHTIIATVYGPDDHKETDRSHFMTAMVDRAVTEMRRNAQEFKVWGAPDTVRDLLYVDDQISAVLTADRHFTNAIVNCSSNHPVTIGAVATSIVAALGWSVPIVYPPQSFRGTPRKTLDSRQFLDATGWRPEVDLETGIRRVLSSDYGI
jgi:GDP-L-fucose synthase